MLKEKLWTRNYVILAITNLLFFLSFQLVVPVLPLYIESLGGTNVIIGIIIGAGTLGGLAARPISGAISDRYARLPVYYWGLILCCVMIFAYALFPILLFLLIIRLLHGFSMGAVTTSGTTMVTDMLPKTRLAEGMGYYGMASTVAMAFSPAIALFLINIMSYAAVFRISFLIVLITLIISLFLKKSDLQIIKPREEKEALYEKKAFPAAIMLAVQSCGYCAVATFIALYGGEMGIKEIGIFFTVYALCVIISRPWVGTLADRKGYNYVIIPSLILSAIGFLIISLSHSLAPLLAGGALIGIGFGSAFPTFQAMAVCDVPVHRRGAATATVMSGFDLGFGIGAIIWGVAAHLLGYRMMYFLNVPVLVISLIIYLKILGKKKQSEVVA
ncbi:MAG: MFS transporter [Clostridiales bacterium]